MADTKITALTALTGADPANDVIPIVDVSDTTMAASGTTKKISVNNILGASGTATLASATITGDLTVKTNVLKVDTTNNRVGVLTASPSAALHVNGVDTTNVLFNGLTKGIRFVSNASTSQITGVDNTGSASYQPLSIGGSALDFSLSGSTAMTLNATGLGVGTSPSFKLDVLGSATISGRFRTSGALNALYFEDGGTTPNSLYIGTSGDTFRIITGNSVRMNVDSSGNVGIGVTPSAWSAFKAIDIGTGSSISGASSTTALGFNNYWNGSNYIYKLTAAAGDYRQTALGHAWYTAPSGTAGNNITFTQAMTLDASGNLLVGTTGLNGSWNTKLTLSNDSGTTKWAVGPYLGGVTNFLISAGASAGVYLNGTAATSWTSASDERLKDIIEPISNAIAKVGSLRAVIGKFKFDENNTRKPFLIAQDVQSVLPEAVDASNPEKLGVAYTDVIPLLVAAIKELTARVQTLETR